jgi:vacuolar-type H+-ATPase subunit F/Vma7
MVKLYPNPNNGQFTLELRNIGNRATVTVYNMLGVKVYNSVANNQTNLNINLPELQKGIYVVKVADQKEQFTKKMIVN